jgi:hypothetical protein
MSVLHRYCVCIASVHFLAPQAPSKIVALRAFADNVLSAGRLILVSGDLIGVTALENFTSVYSDGIYQVVGVLGAGCYILGYSGLQLRFWQGTSLIYILINLVAAGLVLISLANNFNLASAIIQITWIVISIFGIGRTTYLNSYALFTDDEAALLKAKFGAINKISARNFLNAGHWIDAEVGTVIAHEREPIGALFYLSEGSALVEDAGVHVGTCLEGSFIGELTCLDGGAASAAVTIVSPSRLFRIGTPALQDLCEKDSDLNLILKSAISDDTRIKLLAANQRLAASGAASV